MLGRVAGSGRAVLGRRAASGRAGGGSGWPLALGLPVAGYGGALLALLALDGPEAAEEWDPLGLCRWAGLTSTGKEWRLAPPQAAVTDRVWLEVEVDGVSAGRMEIGLYGKAAPATVDNFRGLCAGAPDPKFSSKPRIGYAGSPFHRIIPGFMVQGGDVRNQDGSGGCSIYGGAFKDEPAALQLKHTGPGVVSMANRGLNTQTSQFFITTAAAPHLDGKHSVLGCVLDGQPTLAALERLGTKSGRPRKRATVAAAGRVEE